MNVYDIDLREETDQERYEAALRRILKEKYEWLY